MRDRFFVVRWVAALALACAGSLASASTLPRPEALEPQIQFWKRVYSEVDRSGGLIHDTVQMDVVYETLRVPEALGSRAAEQRIERVKKGYAAILRTLASGKRTGLSAEESRVLALWPKGTSNATLKEAAGRLRFQLGQADRFREGLIRSGQWHDHIVAKMRKHDVPLELAALPHVESSFNPAAYSSVGAAGLWQFTRQTGSEYMKIDNVIDERMDPFVASESAARLLRTNYQQLGSWPLAITAYNHGVGGMKRAIRMLGTDDIAAVVARYKSPSFGFASRNFYTELLAAIEVSGNAETYFGRLEIERPVAYETVVLDHYYTAKTIETALGIDPTTLRDHNRALRPAVWNGAKYLPRGFELRVPAAAVARPAEVALASIPTSQRFAQQHRDRLYTVRRGDSLSKIARLYGLKEQQLVSLNNLRSRHQIRAGQVLTLPDQPGARAPVAIAQVEAPADGVYRVRSGDTISTIAGRFGMTEQRLIAMNGLRNRNLISIGQSLRVAESEAVREPAPVAVVARVAATPEPAPLPVVVVAATEDADDAIEIEIARIEPDTATLELEAAEIAPEPSQSEGALAPGAVPASEPAAISDEDAIAIATTEDPEAVFDGEPVVGLAPVIPASDPSDYAITPNGSITVQAAETLGHYANWLEVSTGRLRQLNRMKHGAPVVIGRQTKLDFTRVAREEFERRRLEYHHAIQEEFFAAFEVVGTDSHLLKSGDTLWQLAEKRYKVPVWLLRQYNPSLDYGALQVGTRLVIPRIAQRPV